MNADAWWNGLSEADKQRIYELNTHTWTEDVQTMKPWPPLKIWWDKDRWKTEQNPNWWAHHYSEG